jgi:hypothetical protein
LSGKIGGWCKTPAELAQALKRLKNSPEKMKALHAARNALRGDRPTALETVEEYVAAVNKVLKIVEVHILPLLFEDDAASGLADIKRAQDALKSPAFLIAAKVRGSVSMAYFGFTEGAGLGLG